MSPSCSMYASRAVNSAPGASAVAANDAVRPMYAAGCSMTRAGPSARPAEIHAAAAPPIASTARRPIPALSIRQ